MKKLDENSHPGEILLQTYLIPHWAHKMRISSTRLTGIISGEIPIEDEDAIKFSNTLGYSATFWLIMWDSYKESKKKVENDD